MEGLEETCPGKKTQRCWVHKIRTVLSKLPKRMHARAKSSLYDIMMAKNKSDAQKQLNVFETTYKDAFPKAGECLTKDRDALLTFYDFPAAHWQTIRTTNPIESTFATVRLRTAKTRGMGTRATALAMAFKLVEKSE